MPKIGDIIKVTDDHFDDWEFLSYGDRGVIQGFDRTGHQELKVKFRHQQEIIYVDEGDCKVVG